MKQIAPGTWKVPSNTKKDVEYTVVEQGANSYKCECVGNSKFHRLCSHIKAVIAFRLTEEGDTDAALFALSPDSFYQAQVISDGLAESHATIPGCYVMGKYSLVFFRVNPLAHGYVTVVDGPRLRKRVTMKWEEFKVHIRPWRGPFATIQTSVHSRAIMEATHRYINAPLSLF